MPELPEVETVCEELRQRIVGKSFGDIIVLRDKIRLPVPDLSVLEGEKITKVERRAKYINLFTKKHHLVIHLGMSGTVIIDKPRDRKKHDHVVFELSDGNEMAFNDPRRFGLVVFYDDKIYANLGPEPFSAEFSAQYLFEQLQKRSSAVKLSIMDQKIVVGVGNIYASEALYRSKINPSRASNDIKISECKVLVKNIIEVLNEAIISGGSTLRDYVRSTGDSGYFQHNFAVYGKEKEPCKKCKKPIQKITQGGRSTFYCKNCQK